MTTQTEHEQLRGGDATLANTARGQLKAFVDKMSVLVNEGCDTLVAMDLQLQDFDSDSRRLEPTTEESRQSAEGRKR
jgi:hypothetical protein